MNPKFKILPVSFLNSAPVDVRIKHRKVIPGEPQTLLWLLKIRDHHVRVSNPRNNGVRSENI